MTDLDYYQILQVDRRASQQVIERVYRVLMQELRHHPDLGGDEEQAKLINLAYDTLKDSRRRRLYDRCIEKSSRVGVNTGNPVWDDLLEFDLNRSPGKGYSSRCPRCRAQQKISHSVAPLERLQCPTCHWLYRDPIRELMALKARILRLSGIEREFAEKRYGVVLRKQQLAEKAAAAGDEEGARAAIGRKRRAISRLSEDLRWVNI